MNTKLAALKQTLDKYPGNWPMSVLADVMRELFEQRDMLRKALEGSLDSLEYVEYALPRQVGYGVRQERIVKARAALDRCNDHDPADVLAALCEPVLDATEMPTEAMR